jgi:hypothetical protein
MLFTLLAGLPASGAEVREIPAENGRVLQQLSAIQDSLTQQQSMFEYRFGQLEKDVARLRGDTSFSAVSIAMEDDPVTHPQSVTHGQCKHSSGCPCGLEAGVEATFLKIFKDTGFDEGISTQAAPRIWLGYRYNDCWGMRATYWDYSSHLSGRQVVGSLNAGPPGFGAQQTLDASGAFDYATVDLELTRRFGISNWSLVGSIGARYGDVSQPAQVAITELDLSNDEVVFNYLTGGNDFSGLGLTFAIDGNRQFGFWNLALVGKLRGSVLWGESTQTSVGSSSTYAPDGAGNLILIDAGPSPIAFSAKDEKTLWVGEAQVGVEWWQPFDCWGGGELFVRAVLEVQSWSCGDRAIDADFFGSAYTVGFTR